MTDEISALCDEFHRNSSKVDKNNAKFAKLEKWYYTFAKLRIVYICSKCLKRMRSINNENAELIARMKEINNYIYEHIANKESSK